MRPAARRDRVGVPAGAQVAVRASFTTPAGAGTAQVADRTGARAMPTPRGMSGRLNLFQRTMLRWKALHPYNAVHVLGIDAPLDEAALRAAIAAQLEAWGLTGLEVRKGRFRYRGGPAVVRLEVVEGASLAGTVERELNEPFPPGPAIEPFRFFVIPEAGRFRLGLAYDHFVAGGDSVVMLLAAIAARYCRARAPVAAAPALYPGTYRNLFARRPLLLARALALLPALFGDARRTARPHDRDHRDGGNEFVHFRLEAAEARALGDAGRRWGVTLNDLLLAMLLQALAPVAPPLDAAKPRHRLAVASIVNARRDFGYTTDAVFGQFLASMRVSHAGPERRPLQALAGDVRRATAGVKGGKLYLRTLPALGVAALAWPFLSRERRQRFFAKSYPVWGGVSTLDVNRLWPGGSGRCPTADYLRGVPTGPLSPLVLAVTLTADVVNVGVTFRRTVFSRDAVADVVARLRASIQSLRP